MRKDAVLAVENIARVALTSLHAVMVAVTLQPNGGTAGLTHTHAALVVAVWRTADH